MMSIRLAWRNLQRNKKRTLLTSIALAVGLGILIFIMAFQEGFERQSYVNFIRYQYAHVKGLPPGILDHDFPGLQDYHFENVNAKLVSIRKNKEVLGATSRLAFNAKVYAGLKESFVQVVGVDLDQDRKVYRTLEALNSGKLPEKGEDKVLLGYKLARELDLDVGDLMTILVRSAPGALNPRQVEISGLLRSGHPDVDRNQVYISNDIASKLAILDDSATEVALLLNHADADEKVKEQFQALFPEIEWHTWEDLAADFITMSKIKRTAQTIIFSIFVVIAGVGIANTMLMSVHERTREIGALRAMGFSRGLVRRIFLYEGILIGLIAGGVGLILGIVATWLFSIKGFSFENFDDMELNIPINESIYPQLYFIHIIRAIVFGLIMSIIASWGAATRASRGEIVRALREGMI